MEEGSSGTMRPLPARKLFKIRAAVQVAIVYIALFKIQIVSNQLF